MSVPPRFIVRKAARSLGSDLADAAGVVLFKQRCRELQHLGVDVGWAEGKTEADGTPLALIAAANNFGATIPITRDSGNPGRLAAPRTGAVVVIPERPFMKQAFNQGKPLFRRLNQRNLGLVLKGSMKPEQAIGQLGAAAVGEVQKQIRHGDFAPNAPSTIAAKGSSQPLVDKGTLWQQCAFEISTTPQEAV